MQNKKVSIIGVGNVGATLAYTLALQNICSQIVLKDIKEDYTKGITLDISQSIMTCDTQTKITQINEYKDINDSQIVVITAGSPRLEGMNREDLFLKNTKIIEDIVIEIVKYAPNSIIIVVSNPLDAMVYKAFKKSNFPKSRVLGMAGVLDSARMAHYISQKLENSSEKIEALVIGEHGNGMIPLENHSKVGGKRIDEIFTQDELCEISENTKKGGATIIDYLKNSSAYFAPAQSTALLVKAILDDSKAVYPCSAVLNGEYGYDNVAIGVPVVLGKNGVEKIVELDLLPYQKELLNKSVNSVKKLLSN